MKKLRIAAALLALVLLLTPLSSLAELERGSRGDEVKELQKMLIDLGFLNDKADGIFGKKTEAAVKALQDYWGMEKNGIADEDIVNELTFLWQMAMGVATEDDVEEEVLQSIFSDACGWYEYDEDDVRTDHCYRHYRQEDVYFQLAEYDSPDKLTKLLAQRLSEYWLADIDAMYDDWEASLPAEEQHIAREQRQIYQDSLAQNQKDWAKRRGKDTADYWLQQALWLDEIGVGLCFDLYGAEEN